MKPKKLKYEKICLAIKVIWISLLIGIGIALFNGIKSFNSQDNSSIINVSNFNLLSKSYKNKDRFVIVLDAGHGDWDIGAEGITGAQEKDINLDVTLELGRLLEQYDDIEVVYTRENDDLQWSDNSTENLYERVNISTDADADIFISIHCNSSYESNNYRGVETWYNSENNEGYYLSALIQEELSALEYTLDRGLKTYEKDEALAVLEHNSAAAALIELGFISNYNDEDFLTNLNGKKQCALAISEAILEYKNENWDIT